MKFILLHGKSGNSQSSWLPWLKNELEEQGHTVWVPNLPNADKPNAKIWKDYILANAPFACDKETVVIGHSAGAVTALYLIQYTPLRGGIFVAAFENDLGWPELSDLFFKPLNFTIIKANSSKLLFMHSDDDPHCPLEGAKHLAQELEAKLVVLPGMKHFSLSTDPRFTELPEILPLIQEVIS
jgi:predicted alpha/beta hydrolase family esterase